MSVPAGLKYSKEHEWLKDDGAGKFRVGITDYAQGELGDVVFIDLPEIGRAVKQGESFASVESVKAVSDVYAPVDGTIVEVNGALSSSPELVNTDPHDKGWMIVLQSSDSSQLSTMMDSGAYEAFLKEIAK